MILRERFPRTYEALSALPDGEGALAHLIELEQGFGRRSAVRVGSDGPDRRHVAPEYDVALAGGGLSLIYAAQLARRGCKVVVFDRRRIGCGHREWNVSRAELDPIWRSGLMSRDEVDALVRMSYRAGICRWHGGGTYPVRGVLDCVVDAEGLLETLRHRAEAAGAVLLDHHQLVAYRTGPAGVAVSLLGRSPQEDGAQRGRPVELTARLLLDGMGAQSPHARFDLCCPTVGGVMSGLQRGPDPLDLDPQLGEILVTTEGVEDGRQHVWEGFPAPPPEPAASAEEAARRTDRMTIYLFHYCEPAALPAHPLLSLYERFFETLPRYKRGALRLDRPTYGFIPAYTRLRPMPAAPRDRVLLVGDAASRHSPLTFCGFGAMMRSFWPVSDGILRCLEADRLARQDLSLVWDEPPALRVMGGLTLMMAPSRPRGGRRLPDADAINRLLDAAFHTLHDEGEAVYAAFIRDEIGFEEFRRFLQGTAQRYPTIYREVFQHLRPGELARWVLRLLSLRSARPRIAAPAA